MQQAVQLSPAAKSFAELGYIIIPRAADPAILMQIERDIADVFRRRASAAGLEVPLPASYDDLSNLIIALKQHDQNAYLQAAKTANHLASLSQLCVSPQVMALVRDLGLLTPTIATRTVLHFMANSLAIEGGYLKTPPHQDFRSAQGSLNFDRAVDTARRRRAGRLSGRCRGRQSSSRAVAVRRARLWTSDRAVQHRGSELPSRRAEARRYPRVFDPARTCHQRDRRRASSNSRVVPINDAAEASYVDRGLPIPYIYKADMALRTPNFPTPEQVTKVFGP